MQSKIPEKLLKIADQIEESGSAPLTRLTVLKKWFEQNPKRLPSLAIFIARSACSQTIATTDEAADLSHEARALLNDAETYDPQLPRDAVRNLIGRLAAFQNEYKKTQWGPVRLIRDRNLYVIEEVLRTYIQPAIAPSAGYRLAADYCENYDSAYGNCLNGPSAFRVEEIARFMSSIEKREDAADQHDDGAASCVKI